MQITLYTGNTEIDRATRRKLQTWSAQHRHIDLLCESIHANPTVAVRLAITHLPALVTHDEVLAQGDPSDWLTDTFLAELAERSVARGSR